jgi:hypothetical protein
MDRAAVGVPQPRKYSPVLGRPTRLVALNHGIESHKDLTAAVSSLI